MGNASAKQRARKKAREREQGARGEGKTPAGERVPVARGGVSKEPAQEERAHDLVGGIRALLRQVRLVHLLVPLFGAYIASFAMWQDGQGNVVTGLGQSGWGDLLFHIRGAIFFAEQGGWPVESFFLSGEPVGYAFFSDYIAGLLWKLGFSTATAFSIPTVILVFVLLCAFEWVVARMTKSVGAAILSAILFMCFGGLSGWFVLPELSANFWTTLRTLPHGITVWQDADFVILNPFTMMLHQRAYLLGYPLFIVMLYLSWRFLLDKSTATLAVLSVAGILLSLFHPFTWVVFLFVFPSWMAWMMILRVRSYTLRDIVRVGAALGAISLFGLLIVKSLQPSAGASSISWSPGWLAPDAGWPSFWFKNIGLYPILGAVAVHHFFNRNRTLSALVLAGITPFVAANLFKFAPWEWDNTKIFAPVWVILSISVGALLVSWWEQGRPAWKALALALVPVLMLSGGLEVLRIITYRSAPMVISSPRDLSLGEAVRSRIDRRAILLFEPEPTHPVFMYSGRPGFVAYEGWLWSQGWRGKYEQRMADKKIIYAGTDASHALINKNRIAYVTIGPPELQAGANKQWFERNYTPLLSHEGYTIYDVRARRQ